MLSSMTAFARREHEAEWGSAQWELRSVNNRFLDASPRLPDELRPLEIAVRDRIRARLARGKVEGTLRLSNRTGASGGLSLDLDLVRQIADASREIDGIVHDPARVSSLDILRWPGVIRATSLDLDVVGPAVLELLDATLDDLVATRRREGARIAELLRERCAAIEALVAEVRERIPEVIAAIREKIESRVRELVEQPDRDRLEQELVLLAQRLDVTEELDRLQTHVAEVLRVLDADEPAGRRLDFLMQELNREANTLGSKSQDARATRAAVDLKVLIEQMREQVQNVE
ncbi:MAG: YicC family protein [Ectothiorhodospiraceae bacterium]|nr:YicC family protein [Chromatiales bacterium]MCP5153577.1 YicC family protein [Ectothiorhodospiraceae bacterium]